MYLKQARVSLNSVGGGFLITLEAIAKHHTPWLRTTAYIQEELLEHG